MPVDINLIRVFDGVTKFDFARGSEVDKEKLVAWTIIRGPLLIGLWISAGACKWLQFLLVALQLLVVGKASILRSSLSYPPGLHVDIKREEEKNRKGIIWRPNL